MNRDYTIKPAVSEGRDSPDYGFTRLSDDPREASMPGKWALIALFAAAAWLFVIPAAWAVWP